MSTQYSLVTHQGTAMPEATLCEEHLRDPDHNSAAHKVARSAGDYDPRAPWVDSSENQEVSCIVCGGDSE